jgi:glycosyltransferase involved in cell wall biosynthesis
LKILLIDGGRRKHVESGYGRIAAALADGLAPLGHEVIFTLERGIDVCLYTSPPWSMRKVHLPGARRVGFTMHELEELQEGKRDWPDILNTLDLVLTPTAWNRSVWRRLGVRTPIEVVPLGVDPAAYFPGTGHACVFLAVHESLGSPHSRENWGDTLKAYYSAFTAPDRVLLRIKTWKWDPERFEAQRLVEARGRATDELPPVEVVDTALSHAQMRALYLESSLFLKNANREGWSIPCTEAMACGTQVAATSIEPLRSHLPASTLWFAPGDWRGLRELLRRCHREFSADREERRRYASSLTCRLVSESLKRHFSPSP